jgi:hypothetical protein
MAPIGRKGYRKNGRHRCEPLWVGGPGFGEGYRTADLGFAKATALRTWVSQRLPRCGPGFRKGYANFGASVGKATGEPNSSESVEQGALP